MKKKLSPLSYLLFAFIFLLTGCSNSIKSSKDPVTTAVHFYHVDDGEYKNPVATESLLCETKEEALEKGKTIITLVDTEFHVLKNIVNDFNRNNELYYVELEEFDSLNVSEEITRLGIKLSSGKGPDLITSYAYPHTTSCMKSGYYLDLTSFLKEIGVNKETCFNSVYEYTLDDKVYGVSIETTCMNMYIKRNVLGNDEIPSFDEYIDKLLNYPEDAIFANKYQPAEFILYNLLNTSESIRGSIDRENKTCNFNTELFYKMLDVSKRYGEARTYDYPNIILPMYAEPYMYPGEKALHDDGYVTIPPYLDDGNYPIYGTGLALFINSSSTCPEGAKTFISYVLSGYGQSYVTCPVNKRIFDQEMEYLLIHPVSGYEYDLTEDIINDIRTMCEQGKYLSPDNDDILNIITEETGAYFSGDKTKEEVADVLQSRIQLILNE